MNPVSANIEDLHRFDPSTLEELRAAPEDVLQHARLLIGETTTPQSREASCETSATNLASRITKSLQDAIQVPKRAEEIAKGNGIELSVKTRPPVPGTPTGDFFEVISLPDGRASIFVGDAVGHNHQDAWDNSARFNLFVRSPFFVENAYQNGATAKDVLSFLDEHCNFRGRGGTDAVVVSHVLLDPRTGEFQFANAGNPHDLVILKADGEIRNIPAYGGQLANPKLGFQFKDSNPNLVNGIFEKGDIGILMSDGIPDGIHVSGDDMSDELPKVIKGLRERDLTPSQVVDGILNELASTPDDLVIMAFRR